MVFKVLHQELTNEVPIRERTKTLYLQANSKSEVLKYLAEKSINIELIQEIKGKHLEYEQQSENFELENV